jgi:parvulin-like peptidyl-prolyl isomerase
MTRRRHILTALSAALLAGVIASPAVSFQGMGAQGGGAPAGHGAMGTLPAGHAPLDKAKGEPPSIAPEPVVDPSEQVELPPVVAKVDGKEFSSALFRDYVRDILEARPESKEEFFPLLKQMALDVAASTDLLKENPALDNDPVVIHEIAKVRARVYPRAFFAREIDAKVKPTDDELLALAPPFVPIYETRVISADRYGTDGTGGMDGAMAKIELAEKVLASGVPFDNVAADPKYNDALSSEKGGRLMALSERQPSPFNAEEFEKIRHLAAGQRSPVFKTRLGYAIVQVDRVIPVAEQRADDLKRNGASYRETLLKREYDRRVNELFGRAKIEWNNATLTAIRDAIDNGAPVVRFMDDELVRVNGTVILARDLVGLAFNHGGNVFDIHLDKRVRTEVVAQETERLGLNGDYLPLLDLARRRAVTRRSIDLRREKVKAGEAELRAFYEKNIDRYRTEEKRRLLIVETASAKTAKDVAKQGRKGKDFEALAAKYNDNPQAREAKGNAGLLPRKNLRPDLADRIFSASAGDVVGPFEMADAATGKTSWSVVKVAEVVPAAVRPFESVNRDALLDKYLANQMEELNQAFLDGVNQRHAVEFLMKPDGGRGNDQKQS